MKMPTLVATAPVRTSPPRKRLGNSNVVSAGDFRDLFSTTVLPHGFCPYGGLDMLVYVTVGIPLMRICIRNSAVLVH